MADSADSVPPIHAEQDAGSELVAEISSRLQADFPDLEHSPEVIRTIQTAVQESSFQFMGPNPPPHMIAEYERICPGWGSRLLEQSEREQLWRIEREREQLAQTRLIIEAEATDRQSSRAIEGKGLTLGFIAFVLIAGIGATALYLGQTAVAITCFTTFVLGVVGMFVTRTTSKHSSEIKD